MVIDVMIMIDGCICIVLVRGSLYRYCMQFPGDTVVSPPSIGAMHLQVHWGVSSHHLVWNSLCTSSN